MPRGQSASPTAGAFKHAHFTRARSVTSPSGPHRRVTLTRTQSRVVYNTRFCPGCSSTCAGRCDLAFVRHAVSHTLACWKEQGSPPERVNSVAEDVAPAAEALITCEDHRPRHLRPPGQRPEIDDQSGAVVTASTCENSATTLLPNHPEPRRSIPFGVSPKCRNLRGLDRRGPR